MTDEAHDISDYQDAIEGMLLKGEVLEATYPAAVDTAPNSDLFQWDDGRSDGPKVIGITSDRLIFCNRKLERGKSDEWRFRSIPYARITEVWLDRNEVFRRDRIETFANVTIYGGGRFRDGNSAPVELRYRNAVMAREVHDRILAHMLEG
jgi:hypothetical protein